MEQDGLEDSLSAAIVEVWGSGAQAPERGGTHLARLGVGLSDTVGQTAHLMEGQIGVERGTGLKARAGLTELARASLHGSFVTGDAVNLSAIRRGYADGTAEGFQYLACQSREQSIIEASPPEL